jgi:paraquat-inducible protein B
MASDDIAKGFVLGAAAVLLGRVLLKALPPSGQPIVRALLRGGSVLSEKAREAAAELGEVIEDTLAELQAESATAAVAQAETAAAQAEATKQGAQQGAPPS